MSGWCSCLNELQLHHRKEPRDQYTESENRLDILMYNETSTELDVSMAHPWSKGFLNRASKEAGYAAERREMRKKSKYEALSVQDGTTPNLVPLVFEHFGFWGQEADNFLNSLSKKSRDSEDRSSLGLPDPCSADTSPLRHGRFNYARPRNLVVAHAQLKMTGFCSSDVNQRLHTDTAESLGCLLGYDYTIG